MRVSTRAAVAEAAFATFTDDVTLRTEIHRQYIDVTDLVAERVRRSGIRDGIVSVQTRHTTAALVVNEDEPLLLRDFDHLLDRLCPRELTYEHDDLARRRDVPPEERANGASHCRTLLLGTGQTLHVAQGQLQLGRWQRLLLVELDGPRPRMLSIAIFGSRA
jgi:secondary thiamine-phosphate synthase enzyme